MATTPRSEDLIAEARAAVEGHAPTEAEVLAYRLADALEVAEKRATEAEANRDEFRTAWNTQGFEIIRLEDQLAAALAVIEKARNVELDRDVPLYRAWPDRWDEAQRILSSAPADVLRERDAEKWDEAVEEAHALGWLHDFAKSDALARNPYRAAKGEQK